MTGIRAGAANRYLEECASACPYCEQAGGIRRIPSEGRFVGFSDEAPRFLVPCYCARCGREWTEGYALVSVELRPLGSRS
jgi:hypothetical protein